MKTKDAAWAIPSGRVNQSHVEGQKLILTTKNVSGSQDGFARKIIFIHKINFKK